MYIEYIYDTFKLKAFCTSHIIFRLYRILSITDSERCINNKINSYITWGYLFWFYWMICHERVLNSFVKDKIPSILFLTIRSKHAGQKT